MRDQLLAGLRAKRFESNLFLPLCVWDFYDELPGYKDALADGEDYDPMSYYGSERGMAYRLDFCKSIQALLLGWCEGHAYNEHIDPSVKRSTHHEGNRRIDTIETPIGSLQQVSVACEEIMAVYTTEHILKTPADARTYQYIVEATSLEANYDYAAKQLAIVGQGGIVNGVGFGVPFHAMVHMFGPETFLMMSFDIPREVADLMAAMHNKNLERCLLLAGSPLQVMDHESLWDARLISPTIFREHFVPVQREYNAVLQGAGKICLDHASGQEIGGFIEGLEAIGHDIVYGITLEDGTINEIAELLDRWAGRITPCMGPDPDFLRRYKRDDVARLMDTFLDRIDHRPLLMGTADAVVPGTPVENLAVIAECLGLS
jgi:hypothetical protein